MKGFDVLKIKSAVKSRNRLDLSAPVLASMDIGQIVPLGTWEMVPGDDFKVHMNAFSRLAPLVEPTYGKVQFKTVCGFVPYHQVAWDCEAWFAGKTTFEGVTPHGRFITLEGLSYFYRQYCLDGNVTATAINCDISWIDASNVVQYGVFSNLGRYFNKVLNSLGYCFPQNTNLKTGSDWKTRISSIKLSAYPLLAFGKLYNDYMSQSQRFNTSALSYLLQNVKYGKDVTSQYTASTGIIDSMGILTILQNVKLNYENDYFTSAWQSPNNPLYNLEQISSVAVPGSFGNGVATQDLIEEDSNNTRLVTATDNSGLAGISQRAMLMLRSFDNWVRRNHYSGSRPVQQLYSRFGIKTDDYRSNYAHVLGTDVIPIQIGDVTATAATNPSGNSTIPLGDYAGKGIMSGEIGCAYKSSDYGMLFILGYYTVTPLNAYGFDRSVLRNSPLDFYNPEFDGIGAEAIPLMEFFENPKGAAIADATLSDSVFGFTERYNSYRYGRAKILGDWRKFNNDDPMNAWHTGRLLSSVRKGGYLVAQSASVNTLPQTGSEYNRIFSVTNGDVDHFYLTGYMNVSAVRPMLNLNQAVDLGEGDTTVPRNGNVIS